MQTPSIFQRYLELIEQDNRDIALLAYPGIGLSTLIRELSEANPSAHIDVKRVNDYWEREYKGRSKNRRFIVDASIMDALASSGFSVGPLEEPYLFRSNFQRFLTDEDRFKPPAGNEQIFIMIDNFSYLSEDIMKLFLDRMKNLDDQRTEDPNLAGFRFVIGGVFDFEEIYKTDTLSGVSPATNFRKHYPQSFLLSELEIFTLLNDAFPELDGYPVGVKQLIADWSGGYVHYIIGFAEWILGYGFNKDQITIQELVRGLRTAIEDQNRIPLFNYCFPAWEQASSNVDLCELLRCVITTGFISDSTYKTKDLAIYGVLFKEPRTTIYYLPNKLIEMFFRQRLAELSLVLPIKDSALWCVPSLNAEAYQQVLDIENHLRTFIGDQLYSEYGPRWVDEGLVDVVTEGGKRILEEAITRRDQEMKNPFTTDVFSSDSILMYLDFGDLIAIIERHSNIFLKCNENFVNRLDSFSEELNYYRRRVAHNRSIYPEQIQSLRRLRRFIRNLMH